MTFVEQGAKQPVLGCFLAELDVSNKSFTPSSSVLENHNDTNVQGVFAARTLDYFSKSSPAIDPTLQLASSSAIPHWMSSKQVQNISLNTSLKNRSTENVVPSTSMPQFSQVHETLGAFSSLPSPEFDFGSEGGQTKSSIGEESRDDLAKSRYLFEQQVPARPPLSVCFTPSLSLKVDGQKEELKGDTLSLLLHKQEMQPAKECPMDLPTLSLGHSSGQLLNERADVSSWVSKFPFQIALASEQAECGQLIQQKHNLAHRLLTNIKSECLIQGASKGFANIPSQMGSKGQINHCKFLPPSSTTAANDALPEKTSLASSPLNSPWPLPATSSGSSAPSLKRDWNATLTQGAKHAQLLPDFFSQQKVTVAAKASPSHFAKIEHTEMRSKVAFSQKSMANSEVNAGSNLPSLHETFCSDKIRKSSIDPKSIKQQEINNGGEALKTRTLPSLESPPRQVDLLRVKHETLTEESKSFNFAKFGSRESTEGHDKIAGPEGRVLTKAILLSSGPVADQAARQPSSITLGRDRILGNSQAAELMLFRDGASTDVSKVVSAGLSSLPLLKHSLIFQDSEGGKCPANTYVPLDRNWGDFLTAPSVGQTSKNDAKRMLPFQQRFEQLQKFLEKCDRSDNEYCLRALWSLSGTARSNHSTELESRALRLSLEEGKEMKRARLLNVLEEFPEGTCMNLCAGPMAP